MSSTEITSDYQKTNCPSEACSACEKEDCSSRIEPSPPVQTEPNGLSRVNHTIVVLSGKGGVGKSTVSAHLALSLAAKGFKVGLLDADIHGPSIPTLFNRVGTHAEQFGDTVEPLSVCQLIGSPDGAVIVTTPQEVAAADVRKSVQFCRKLDLPILGILENMSGYTCPKCGESIDLFGKNGGRKLCEKYNLAFLGRIPIDPNVGRCGDSGQSFLEKHGGSPAMQAFEKAVEQIDKALKKEF